MATAIAELSARTLVSPEFFTRLSSRVVQLNELDPGLADRITEQTLAYLATCAQKPAGAPSLGMSPLVDLGWHAFMEYTRQYDEFFSANGWPKVHHNPCDRPDGDYEPAVTWLPKTEAAIAAAGYPVDKELWQATRTDCGDTCGDDGGGGNPLPTCEHSV
ncbi:hypothetical protein AB0E21_05030 [Streptomyces sp. NPDC047967]|uniref:hypothetical protein n=1 Tax=Streptomyces sp. NPDC047967 TaxID=3154924 RepID=UPI0033CFE105